MILPKVFNFTQSNLQDYVDCPYRFYLRYIKHLKWPALIVDSAVDFEKHTRAGARFHRMVQQYLLGVPEAQIHNMAYADPNPEIATWWENFINFIPLLLNGKHLVEAVFSTHLAEHRLLAKYDLILIQEGDRLVIFDWKTSSKKPRKEWLIKKIQTRLYRYILTQAGTIRNSDNLAPSQVLMNYWYTSFPESPISLQYDQNTYEKDHSFFTRLINEIQENEKINFVRTSNTRMCRYCLYRSHCDRGVKAGDLESFEDFEKVDFLDTLDTDFENISEIEF